MDWPKLIFPPINLWSYPQMRNEPMDHLALHTELLENIASCMYKEEFPDSLYEEAKKLALARLSLDEQFRQKVYRQTTMIMNIIEKHFHY